MEQVDAAVTPNDQGAPKTVDVKKERLQSFKVLSNEDISVFKNILGEANVI